MSTVYCVGCNQGREMPELGYDRDTTVARSIHFLKVPPTGYVLAWQQDGSMPMSIDYAGICLKCIKHHGWDLFRPYLLFRDGTTELQLVMAAWLATILPESYIATPDQMCSICIVSTEASDIDETILDHIHLTFPKDTVVVLNAYGYDEAIEAEETYYLEDPKSICKIHLRVLDIISRAHDLEAAKRASARSTQEG